jgi:hypothetical protein
MPVDFPAMMHAKLTLLRKMFEQDAGKIFETQVLSLLALLALLVHKCDTLTRLRRGAQSYKDFFAKAEFWLRPYGLFCYFRDLFGTANPDE